MRHPELSIAVDKVKTAAARSGVPYIIDYIIGKTVMLSKRNPELEERRMKSTMKLKNLVLYHLIKIKQEKNKTTFKEVLSNVIKQKKDNIKRERKKRMQLSDTNPN